MKTIGIDIGTTTISGVVLETQSMDTSDRITIKHECKAASDIPGAMAQDAELLVTKAKEVLDELLERSLDCRAIGLTGQMHGIVYTDASGCALSPLYTWQDRQGDLAPEGGVSMIRQIREMTGRAEASGYGLVTHLCLSRDGRVPEDAVQLCTVPDYLGMKLTGRKRPLMHTSMAASLGFYLVRENRFDDDALRSLGLCEELLPEITGDILCAGCYRGLPVTAAAGDNQASFYGAAGDRADTALLNIGTGGQISVLSDTAPELSGIEIRPFMKGRYLMAGASLCGGRAYAILERFFREYMKAARGGDTEQYDIMQELALQALQRRKKNGGSDCLKVDTAFQGTRTEPGRAGSIRNLREDNLLPGELILGVTEGIVDELFEFWKIMEAGTGRPLTRLVGSGNGLRRNPVMQEIAAQRFGCPLEMSRCREEAASGAALAAAGLIE